MVAPFPTQTRIWRDPSITGHSAEALHTHKLLSQFLANHGILRSNCETGDTCCAALTATAGCSQMVEGFCAVLPLSLRLDQDQALAANLRPIECGFWQELCKQFSAYWCADVCSPHGNLWQTPHVGLGSLPLLRFHTRLHPPQLKQLCPHHAFQSAHFVGIPNHPMGLALRLGLFRTSRRRLGKRAARWTAEPRFG